MKLYLCLGFLGLFFFAAGSPLEAKTAEDWYAEGFEQSLNGQNEKAVRSFQNALKLKRDWAQAHHGLAVLYYRMNEGVLAVHHLRRAEKLYAREKSPEAKKNLAIVRNNLQKAYGHFGLDPKEFEEMESLHPPPQSENWESAGVGFLFGRQGFLLTLNHTVKDARNIRVRFADGSGSPAVLVRQFMVYGLAVLKLNDPSRPAKPGLELGDSSTLRAGDPVFTPDYPNSSRAMSGLLPLKGKLAALEAIQHDENLFEVDLPLETGRGGGPLLNSSGEVVGIHLSKPHAIQAFQAAGRAPQGEIALKSSYLKRVLGGVSGVKFKSRKVGKDRDSAIPSKTVDDEMSEKARQSLVVIEIQK
ncbi:MAG: trypsin-like peptidase domain-containing protein [Nitrospinaceae bacterium]